MDALVKGAAQIERAIAIAVEAHRGQVNKVGAPYILHALAVMQDLIADAREWYPHIPVYVIEAAVLHDVVEDTKYTLEDLKSRGVSTAALAVIDILTRRKGEETYMEYIRRVRDSYGWVRVIKRFDLRHNMGRLSDLPKSDAERLEYRYRVAFEALACEQDLECNMNP